MSRTLLASALVLLGGCDKLFGLDHFPVRSSEAFIRDGDFDHDSDPNDSDLCPSIDATEIGANTDQDLDGVGDACDPHPSQAGDCLLLFDDFPQFGPPWLAEGEPPVVDSDNYYAHFLHFDRGPYPGDEEIIWLDRDLDLDAVELGGYVQAGDLGQDTDRYALALYVDLARTPEGRPSGVACAAESNGTSSQLVALTTTAGVDKVSASVPTGAALLGPPYDVMLHWGPFENGTACRGGADPRGWTVPPTVSAPMPKGHTFALRGIGIGLNIYYVIGWGRCS